MPSLPDPKTTKDQITKIDIGNTGRDLSGNVAGRDIFQKITQVFSGGPDLARNQRNRQAMLKLVKDFWVKGVLEKSLHGKILIELQMEARQDAVEHPWEMVLQMSDQVNQPLPFGTKIIDVFDDANQALLILGAPGSGKTTMLLELARDTIFRAEKDESQRMPVVFNLSSWTGQTIAEWLLEELSTKYNIPKKIARPWLENDEFLLLFDGLDEVALDRRNNCVEAINIFHQDHLIPLAVCSRIADYEALSARLKLHTAVLLQPLTDKQIEDYLTRAGVNLTAVQQALQHDASLYQLAQSPLMLSVMTLAYQGVSIDELPPSESIEERRQHVFSTYVQQMFKRRQVESDYSPKDTVHWLAWLAQNLSKHAQTIFVIERMQPSWLTSKQQQIYILITHLLAGLLGGFCGGMLGGAGIGLLIETNQLEPFGVFLGGFLGALIGSNWRLDKIKPVEILKWSWATTRRRLVGGLIFGSCIGLGGLAIFSSFFDIELGLFVGWTLAAIGISLFMLIGGLISEEIETRIDPNQGIWQSLRNSLVIGVVFGFVFFGAFELYAGVLIDRVALLFDMYVTSASRQFILYGGGCIWVDSRVIKWIKIWRICRIAALCFACILLEKPVFAVALCSFFRFSY